MSFQVHRGTNISHWLSQSKQRGAARRAWFTREDVQYIANLRYAAGFDHLGHIYLRITVVSLKRPAPPADRLAPSPGVEVIYEESVDAADEDTYNRIRQGANFRTVLANIRGLVEIKRRLGSSNPRLLRPTPRKLSQPRRIMLNS